jgi:CheY-like chemotaxis protein
MEDIAGKKLILLVDDTPASIQVIRNILKDSYTTRIATNGTKALELAKELPQPDLILLDVMMPDLDGYEV